MTPLETGTVWLLYDRMHGAARHPPTDTGGKLKDPGDEPAVSSPARLPSFPLQRSRSSRPNARLLLNPTSPLLRSCQAQTVLLRNHPTIDEDTLQFSLQVGLRSTHSATNRAKEPPGCIYGQWRQKRSRLGPGGVPRPRWIDAPLQPLTRKQQKDLCLLSHGRDTSIDGLIKSSAPGDNSPLGGGGVGGGLLPGTFLLTQQSASR